MPLASYQVICIDPSTGLVIKILDAQAFHEMKYSRVYNGVGTLAITMPLTVVNSAMMNRVDMFMVVQRTSPVTNRLIDEETYLARRFQRYRQDNDERFSIGAVSLNHLLSRRIIDVADDPLAAGGYSTKSGAADAVLFEYASQQMGAGASPVRQFQGLTIAGAAGTFPSIGLRLRYDNLLKVFQDICKQKSMDFQITRTSGINMQLSIGQLTVNRTQAANFPVQQFVLLNPLRANLFNPSFTRDYTDEMNFVYMQGKGQGTNRALLKQSNATSVSLSPFNRIEWAADSRNTEKGNTIGLITDAASALKEKQALTKFEFEPQATQPGNIYRLNWDVGDLVTATWDTDTADVRMTGVEISVSGSGDMEEIKVSTQVL